MLAQKGDGKGGEGQGLVVWVGRGSEGWVGFSGAKEGSEPDQDLGGPGGALCPQEGCAAQGLAPEKSVSPSLGLARLGWTWTQLALSRAGDSPAPKGAWVGGGSSSLRCCWDDPGGFFLEPYGWQP